MNKIELLFAMRERERELVEVVMVIVIVVTNFATC